VTSGPGYNTLVTLMRSAKVEVQEGRDRKAATKIVEARSIFAASDMKDTDQSAGLAASQDATPRAQRPIG
jgi:hypothetical protein